MSRRRINAADLFCGAGGSSTALSQACVDLKADLHLLAINHWDVAIETHSANHPNAAHMCPFIMSMDQGGNLRSVDEPMRTLTTADAHALVEPFIIPTNHGKGDVRSHSIGKPMPTVLGFDSLALVEPFLVSYYGNGQPHDIDQPTPTVTCKDRLGLVEPKPDGARMDIRFRMLTPRELARAMSFPDSYEFKGNREKVVKQIGNAVPVNLARALCMSLLEVGQ